MPPTPPTPRPTVRQRSLVGVGGGASVRPDPAPGGYCAVLPPERAALVVGLVVAGAILPMLWIISRRVRSGAWTNYDVSVREQRVGM